MTSLSSHSAWRLNNLFLHAKPEGPPFPRKRTSSNNNGTSPALVAIDSKIEQAMDLVKTHLMFAVREEVEVLRSKIVDLETHIHHLETENSILKDHIPDDLLKNLNLGKK